MPQAEPLDPGLALDDWINRVQNLPEEIRFIQDEIADKDRQFNECIRTIEDRDGKIQKWIKFNDSLEPNDKEDQWRDQICENYTRADQLSQDKIALALKLQAVIEKHIRSLDVQFKLLYDRAEPGFTDPDEVPSLLRPSAANHSAPSIRSVSPLTNTAALGSTPSSVNPATNNSTSVTARFLAHPQLRLAQAQQSNPQHAASAPTTPTSNLILNRQRESSAGPTTKRGPRAHIGGQINVPATQSGLARHASLGPGTPKSGPGNNTVPAGRVSSAGPRSNSVKAAASGVSSRQGTPTSTARKKAANKSSLSRVKASARNSPVSPADSDLSEAESVSGDEDGTDVRSRAPSTADGKGAGKEQAFDEAEDDDDGSDNKKYCVCHNVSYGDMVACDNYKCPYEWFHWSCVGLKSGPNGTWYCPVCTERKKSR